MIGPCCPFLFSKNVGKHRGSRLHLSQSIRERLLGHVRLLALGPHPHLWPRKIADHERRIECLEGEKKTQIIQSVAKVFVPRFPPCVQPHPFIQWPTPRPQDTFFGDFQTFWHSLFFSIRSRASDLLCGKCFAVCFLGSNLKQLSIFLQDVHSPSRREGRGRTDSFWNLRKLSWPHWSEVTFLAKALCPKTDPSLGGQKLLVVGYNKGRVV